MESVVLSVLTAATVIGTMQYLRRTGGRFRIPDSEGHARRGRRNVAHQRARQPQFGCRGTTRSQPVAAADWRMVAVDHSSLRAGREVAGHDLQHQFAHRDRPVRRVPAPAFDIPGRLLRFRTHQRSVCIHTSSAPRICRQLGREHGSGGALLGHALRRDGILHEVIRDHRRTQRRQPGGHWKSARSRIRRRGGWRRRHDRAITRSQAIQ